MTFQAIVQFFLPELHRGHGGQATAGVKALSEEILGVQFLKDGYNLLVHMLYNGGGVGG